MKQYRLFNSSHYYYRVVVVDVDNIYVMKVSVLDFQWAIGKSWASVAAWAERRGFMIDELAGT